MYSARAIGHQTPLLNSIEALYVDVDIDEEKPTCFGLSKPRSG